MKKRNILIVVGVLAAALTAGVNLSANTIASASGQNGAGVGAGGYQFVEFRNSAEAAMLHRAYAILATGDHDYAGHRVKAMESVRAAADLLGVDLRGDGDGQKPQPLSDERLREAQSLITQVLGAAEVKDQKRVVKHLNEAVHQINVALTKH